METAVNKLEALFQKAESDLDYIEQKLEFEIRKSLPDESAAQVPPLSEEELQALQQFETLALKGMNLQSASITTRNPTDP
ncbi:unnamed protein product [Staurois parvus]|uniref:Protein FAM33A n=1 Tax=Staurois parvus TaxID=386267 RepID=A0ABN9GT94_9NEOB|nr:unnamed protein product [Staurois parvus]